MKPRVQGALLLLLAFLLGTAAGATSSGMISLGSGVDHDRADRESGGVLAQAQQAPSAVSP
jgi:hypothetical protein